MSTVASFTVLALVVECWCEACPEESLSAPAGVHLLAHCGLLLLCCAGLATMSHITLSHGLMSTRHGVFQAPGMCRQSRSAHLKIRLERSNNLLTAEQTSRAMERQLQRAKDEVNGNASTAAAPDPSELCASVLSCMHTMCLRLMCSTLSARHAVRSHSAGWTDLPVVLQDQ